MGLGLRIQVDALGSYTVLLRFGSLLQELGAIDAELPNLSSSFRPT